MAIRSSYDSKINKLMQIKPIVLEIEKAMLHGEVHRFSDEILFVTDGFTEVPPFIHPIYSPEKDIAFVDVRGFSSVGQDGNLALKGDVDSELTLLRAKLELVWQRAPRADTFTAFHFSNLIFVRWLADTICHKQGLQLGQKSKVLAVTGLYNIGLYYNNITDEYQINKYAEMISRDFYIPLEEVFSVIDTLDNPFPRDVDEYVEALKKMQISPRLANLNTVGLYAMLGGSWFMTANSIQLVGLAVEYPPCFAAMVSIATRHKIFKKTQIGERVDRANKGGAFDHFARAMNTIINNNLGQINPNRQRAGMESIPYNAMVFDDFNEQSFGMEASGMQIAGGIAGAGLIAAFLTWLWQKLSGGGSGGGSGGTLVEKTEKKVEATVEAKKALVVKKTEAKVMASEIVSEARSKAEAMDDAIVADTAKVVEKTGEKKIETIISRSHNRVAAPLINVAIKYEPSQEPTNHWANMEALVRTFEHIEDPIRLAAIFEVYKRALRGGDQNVRGVITDFIKHPLFKHDPVACGALFCAGRLYHVPNETQTQWAMKLFEIYEPDALNEMIATTDFTGEAWSDIEEGMSSADLDVKYGGEINRIYFTLIKSTARSWVESGADASVLIEAGRKAFAENWTAASFDTYEQFDGSTTYIGTLLETIEEYRGEGAKQYLEWLKQIEVVSKASNSRVKSMETADGEKIWKHFSEENAEMMRVIDASFRAATFGLSQTLRIHQEVTTGIMHIVESVDKFQGLVNENLVAMKRELDRAGKKAGLESYEDLEGEFIPAQKGVGMELNVWTDVAARVGIAVLVGVFVEWLVRKLAGGSGGGGGSGSYRSSITFRVETASEAVARVGDKLTSTKSDFLAFNTEMNRRKLTDEQLSKLVNTDADKVVLRKFLAAIANDDHLLRAFAVLIVNGASGKDESQFTFLGVSATDRDWDRWVVTALTNFRKTTMPNDMEFEKYLLFCGMSIPGTFAIADVIESIDVTKALQHIEIEAEIVEEIFKIGDGFDDASAKRIADEIRKGASGPASSDSREVAIPGAGGKTYRQVFDTARMTRYSIWPGAIFRAGLKEDETLADIKADKWRTILDTKRLSTKLNADKNTLKRMEDKAKAMNTALKSASASAKLGGRYSSNPEDHQIIADFLGKKSEAMGEIQAYLQAVNAYTKGVEDQTTHMSVACNTLKARIGNVKTLLKKVD